MAEERGPGVLAPPSRDVFISYASQDKAVAEAVCNALESAGLVCWIAPRDVVPGESFAGAIVHAIDATKVIVLVLSEHSAASQHVLRELERASSKRHPVIAFRLDMKPLPAEFEYFLNTSQWLDASAGYRRALTKLVESVRGATAQASAESSDLPARTVASAVHQRWRPALIGSVALVVAVLAYFLVNHFLVSKPVTTRSQVTSEKHVTGPEISDKSIAVLPFADMSEKHDQEYFGDGMAEEILDLLAKIPGLHVPARTSSFYFKGKSEDIPTIARRLMVANVLEGSVRKSGHQVRVTVQLVRADNGYHRWSETYDRTLDDVFKVQDEIAGEVVKALRVSLDTGAVSRIAPTSNSDAHSLLLQAQYWDSRSHLKEAASYYQQAIDKDPNFAEAWAGLARAVVNGGVVSFSDLRQVRGTALHAAERAVELDPKLAAAYCAMGEVRYWMDWDWPAAATAYEKALSLEPGNSEALNGAGQLAASHGRLADALRLWQQAAARDPLNAEVYANLAYTYYAMGRFAEAATAMRRASDLAPNVGGQHGLLAQMLFAAGLRDEALAEAQKESILSFRAYVLAWMYIELGRKVEADAAIAEVERKYADEQAYNIAQLHALRGERDQAFSWLDRAYRQHDSTLVATPPITVDRDMRGLHGDPRWNAFLRDMKLL